MRDKRKEIIRITGDLPTRGGEGYVTREEEMNQ